VQECTKGRREVNLVIHEYDEKKRYVIGVVGDIPALLTFWQMFEDRSTDEALREIGIVAAALPGETVLPAAYDSGRVIPTYSGYKAMLESHPEINMVIEATGRRTLVHELRKYLPVSIGLVERSAANFFINLLTEGKIWVACKADLLHTQNMLKTIIDQMDQEILFIATDGTILDMNKAVLDVSGQTKNALMGRDYCEIFTGINDAECGLHNNPLEEAMETRAPVETLTSSVDEDGRLRYFRIYTQPIFDEAGAINHLIAIRRDITRRASMEQRLQQAERLASIGELSTYMAHEIRNPLFSISGFANSLMRMEGLDKKAREKVEIILAESRRLDDILRSLMNFTRPTEAQVAKVNLNELVKETMTIMALPCENLGISTTVDLDPEVALVKANPDLIKQCLINLVKNSLEASVRGGRIIVTTTMTLEYVTLTVEDTGRGIPDGLREKVFSPFFSTRGKGAGLGLAQTRKIVDEIGGKVDLVSRDGIGTRVTLYLPPILAVAEEEPSE